MPLVSSITRTLFPACLSKQTRKKHEAVAKYRSPQPLSYCEVSSLFLSKKTGPVSWLIIGLGNPGTKYEWTRHNMGFLTVDELADRLNLPVQRLKFKALTAAASLGGESVLLMKPTTYMNLSGESVGEAARFYKIPPERILVISDDVSLPQGKLRIRQSGSAGGHNGIKSIIAHLGSDKFPRMKIGVGGKPHPDSDMAAWVLGKFTGQDKTVMEETIRRAADAIPSLLENGCEYAMSKFNG